MLRAETFNHQPPKKKKKKDKSLFEEERVWLCVVSMTHLETC